MIRIDTWRIVALMKYLQMTRKFAVRQRPSDSVREYISSMRNRKISVTIFPYSSFPYPTSFSFFDLIPKAFVHWPWSGALQFLCNDKGNLTVQWLGWGWH